MRRVWHPIGGAATDEEAADMRAVRAFCPNGREGSVMDELDDTISFIAEALTFERGFMVSDNDHAREILDWLIELKERRGAPH